jgi:DNA-3-methyladenine glycosylase I
MIKLLEMKPNVQRCPWCATDPLYQKYHDQEWGVPLYDDPKLFEFLTLETFQAGLSWITILRKRENFRIAFDGFDPQKISQYDTVKTTELLQNKGIIRNRQKIIAAVKNAQKFLEIQKKYDSFSQYLWRFVEGKPLLNHFETPESIPAKTPLSKSISKDLKQHGFQFVGPTVVYAHMQATGMVNDHLVSCFRHGELGG